MIRVLLSVFLLSGVVVSSLEADVITISQLNADSNDQLEGTLGGTPVGSGTILTITTVPARATEFPQVTADYLVDNVDLDGDGLFAESFAFAVTLSSIDNINFSGSGEVFGTGPSAVIDFGGSFSIAVDVVSDTSVTHQVAFDGVFEIDFESLVDANFSASDSSGSQVFTALAGNTVLPRLFVDPLFQYVPGGNDGRFGTVEEWSLQFSSVAIPEPSGLLMGGFALVSLFGSRRRT